MTIMEDNADFRIVSKERFEGSVGRWRRFGPPTAAGESLKADGTPDYGIFAPDSVVWKVLLHPATIVFQYAFQGLVQSTYKPVIAGVRDFDPISRKTHNGTVTLFDLFERGQRNSGIHAPMWLGDTETAERLAGHIKQVHTRVAKDTINVDEPELGGYGAANPRDAMWAALTEMHSMLWLYESFAFRDGKLPHRLSPEERDQFIAETAAYCRLVGGPEDEIPTNMAELRALYKKYDKLFGTPPSMAIDPDTGEDFAKKMFATMKKNFHRSQLRSLVCAGVLDHGIFRLMASGAGSRRLRQSLRMGPIGSCLTVTFSKLCLPLSWILQRGPFERYYMRLMWGPDGVELIQKARETRAKYLAAKQQ